MEKIEAIFNLHLNNVIQIKLWYIDLEILDVIWMLLPLKKRLNLSLDKKTFQTRCFEF